MNKTITRLAAAGILAVSLSACTVPGLAASALEPVAQTQPQPVPAVAQTSPTQVQPASPQETTIAIQGEDYTCADVLDFEGSCPEHLQESFDLYGGGIDGFVNSGRLGLLSTDAYWYADAAYAGLLACSFRLNESAEYVGLLQEDPILNLPAEDLDLVFFEAHLTLCP